MRLTDIDSEAWIEITEEELSIDSMYQWCVSPDCGAVVLFSGTVRNFSEGRESVERLSYEAYESVALEKMAELAAAARARFDQVRKIVMVHRVGEMMPRESTVVVVTSAAHRDQAFESARFLIDSLKKSVPIWKKEFWREGSDWGLNASSVVEVGEI